jgi:hypothetical protein
MKEGQTMSLVFMSTVRQKSLGSVVMWITEADWTAKQELWSTRANRPDASYFPESLIASNNFSVHQPLKLTSLRNDRPGRQFLPSSLAVSCFLSRFDASIRLFN